MKVGKDKVVTLTYVLRMNDETGEIIQEVDESRPFVHLFGAGTLLPAFESSLDSLEPEATFSFPIPASDAYGGKNDEAIIELENSLFEIDGKIDDELLAIGNVIAMQDQDGNPVDGRVLEVKDGTVIMDFNHPLAGQDIHFSGKIIDVREATKEELEHNHVHGDGGHQH
ncbi:MAG: FKBP-type peptidyl-prolyl cis-trans isomerase [Bacteroidales bacterium]|jgi:FKBP-type peptidyl-prolyl cis-trans isomerase SlyD|nr:FKBP-type peptidyl-prolyl cis-trans isomerase [Bacteroidales bacterium]